MKIPLDKICHTANNYMDFVHADNGTTVRGLVSES